MKNYFKMMRPDNWFKNIFIVPGLIVGYIANNFTLNPFFLVKLILLILSICVASSANYVINEWLDRDYDKFHPVKKNRPAVSSNIVKTYVYLLYFFLLLLSLFISFYINKLVFYNIFWLLLMGILYNVKPFRTKDLMYLDVLSESINNPIRFLLGWYTIVPNTVPPISLLIAYWMGGAFLMAVKRYSEFKFINNPTIAGLYRRSFTFYNLDILLSSAFLYALLSATFGSIFLIKYKIELLIAIPFYCCLFVWYLNIGFKDNSAAQHPEHMHKEKKFLIYLVFVSFLSALLLFVKIPILNILTMSSFNI